MLWSVPLARVAGVSLRVHVVFLLFVAFELVLSVSGARLGPSHVAMAIGALVFNVVVRELARAMAAQSLGGEPMPVVLWPLGSLSSHDIHGPRLARVSIAASGTAIGLALSVSLAGALLLSGVSRDLVLFNPFDPAATAGRIGSPGVLALWWAYAVTVIVTLVNLLPIYPLDSGRVIEAAVGDREVRRAGVLVACRVGMIGAMVLFVAAMTASSERLMGVGVFAGMVCWFERRRAEFIADPLRPHWRATVHPRPRPRGSLDPLERLEADLDRWGDSEEGLPEGETGERPGGDVADEGGPDPEAELDAILAKISRSGLESLTAGERSTLDAVRERKLRRQNPGYEPPKQ